MITNPGNYLNLSIFPLRVPTLSIGEAVCASPVSSLINPLSMPPGVSDSPPASPTPVCNIILLTTLLSEIDLSCCPSSASPVGRVPHLLPRCLILCVLFGNHTAGPPSPPPGAQPPPLPTAGLAEAPIPPTAPPPAAPRGPEGGVTGGATLFGDVGCRYGCGCACGCGCARCMCMCAHPRACVCVFLHVSVLALDGFHSSGGGPIGLVGGAAPSSVLLALLRRPTVSFLSALTR